MKAEETENNGERVSCRRQPRITGLPGPEPGTIRRLPLPYSSWSACGAADTVSGPLFPLVRVEFFLDRAAPHRVISGLTWSYRGKQMRTRRTMTVSLPAEMMEQVEQIRKVEHRTRSELVREALRTYIDTRFPAVTPSLDDVRALRRGRREHACGQFVTLDQLLHALDTARRPVGRKRA